MSLPLPDYEHWGAVQDFEEYEVSTHGRVRRNGRTLKPCANTTGYLQVNLSKNNRVTRALVHRLVLAAFRGPCPEGHEAAHADGVRSNNALSNLAWKTPRANAQDKLRHGTNNDGPRNGAAVLSVNDVAAIKSRIRQGEPASRIAKDYSVSASAIRNIRSGASWAGY